MNKHYKLRVFTAFQHWLGTHYTNLPTDSGDMTERARRYLKENPQALDLFAVMESDCDHESRNDLFDHFGFLTEQVCDKCGAKQSVP